MSTHPRGNQPNADPDHTPDQPGTEPDKNESRVEFTDSGRMVVPSSPVVPQFGERESSYIPEGVPTTLSGPVLALIVVAVLGLSLLTVALFLPPISLYSELTALLRDSNTNSGGSSTSAASTLPFAALSADAPTISDDGLTVTVAPDDFQGAFGVHIASLSPSDYLNGALPGQGWHCPTDLPAQHALVSQVYSLTQEGTPPARFELTLAARSDAAFDPRNTALYIWNGATGRWEFVPGSGSASGEPGLRADTVFLPRCAALFRVPETARHIALTLDVADEFVENVVELQPRIVPGSLQPLSSGALQIVLAPGFETDASYPVLPIIQNFADPALVDIATVRTVLQTPDLRTEHARQITAFIATDAGYQGVVIDYRDVPAELRDQYTAFLQELAALLRSQERSLTVVLPPPQPGEERGTWDTGAYDWVAIGQLADQVVARMPLSLVAYEPDGTAVRILQWAVRQVQASKLLLGLEALNIAEEPDAPAVRVGLEDAFAYLGQVTLNTDGPVQPGDTVRAELVHSSGIVTTFVQNSAASIEGVRYEDASGTPQRTIWITSPQTLRRRTTLAEEFHLGGVFVYNLMALDTTPGLENALLAYLLNRPQPVAVFSLGLEWIVRGGDEVLTLSPGQPDTEFTFTIPDGVESITIEAQLNGLSLGGQQVNVAR